MLYHKLMKALRPVHKMALPLGTGALSVLLFALGGVWSFLGVLLFFAFGLLLDGLDEGGGPTSKSPKTDRTKGAM